MNKMSKASCIEERAKELVAIAQLDAARKISDEIISDLDLDAEIKPIIKSELVYLLSRHLPLSNVEFIRDVEKNNDIIKFEVEI